MNAFAAAEANGRAAELETELEGLFDAENTSTSSTAPSSGDFMRVSVTR